MPELNTNFLTQNIDPASQMLKASQINNVLLESEQRKAQTQNALLQRKIDVRKLQREDASAFYDEMTNQLQSQLVDKDSFFSYLDDVKANLNSNGYPENPYLTPILSSIDKYRDVPEGEWEKIRARTIASKENALELLNEGKTTWSYEDDKGNIWPIEGKYSAEGIKKITQAKNIPDDKLRLGSGAPILKGKARLELEESVKDKSKNKDKYGEVYFDEGLNSYVQKNETTGEIKVKKDKDKSSEKGEVTWTTATNNLSKRFGKQDAIGNIIITPELQNRHRLAQIKLVELKNEDIEPLDAVNKAEDYANTVEENYKIYLKAAKTKEQKEKVKNTFKSKYGYIPN